jgi:hypothetical protein
MRVLVCLRDSRGYPRLQRRAIHRSRSGARWLCLLRHPSCMMYEAFARDGLILWTHLRPHVSPETLRRDVGNGTLVHVRRGAYAERATWEGSDERQRHILRMRAANEAARRPLVFAGLSAAAAHGMPVKEDWPDEVTVLEQWRGGGRSAPGVRRIVTGRGSARTVSVDGLLCTDIARTALDVARGLDFADAVGSVDWALWRRNEAAVSRGELHAELERMNVRAGASRLRAIIEFASPLSDSFGESAARAAIHILGFAAPELQVEIRDATGLMIPDFYWRAQRRVGEFDGKEKYTRHVFTGGDPSAVVWKEKKREDRLRALGLSVTRILTEHVENPRKLESMLVEAGVPRRIE